MEEATLLNKGEEILDLPPGFRFHPTDEEIIISYLVEKVRNPSFSAVAIGEADLNKSEPWDLPMKAKMGEKEWYFFCQKDRKYPTGTRTNRATESGYWKATGKDKEIFRSGKGCLVGMKKTLVFYKGRAPKGEKTNWVMHEYRLEGKVSHFNIPKSAKDEWVVCRVYNKLGTAQKKNPFADHNVILSKNSFDQEIDHLLDYSSLPPLMDPGYNPGRPGPSFSVQDSNLHQTLLNPRNQVHVVQNPNLYSNPNSSYLRQAENAVLLHGSDMNAVMSGENAEEKNTQSFRSFDDLADMEYLLGFDQGL